MRINVNDLILMVSELPPPTEKGQKQRVRPKNRLPPAKGVAERCEDKHGNAYSREPYVSLLFVAVEYHNGDSSRLEWELSL